MINRIRVLYCPFLMNPLNIIEKVPFCAVRLPSLRTPHNKPDSSHLPLSHERCWDDSDWGLPGFKLTLVPIYQGRIKEYRRKGFSFNVASKAAERL